MKRTTILLPNDLAYLLDRERRRRGVSTAEIVREAIAAHFNVSAEPRRIGFADLGRGGPPDLGENDEKYLDEGWGSAEFFEDTMGRPRERSDLDDPNQEERSSNHSPEFPATNVVAAEADTAAVDDADQGA